MVAELPRVLINQSRGQWHTMEVRALPLEEQRTISGGNFVESTTRKKIGFVSVATRGALCPRWQFGAAVSQRDLRPLARGVVPQGHAVESLGLTTQSSFRWFYAPTGRRCPA